MFPLELLVDEVDSKPYTEGLWKYLTMAFLWKYLSGSMTKIVRGISFSEAWFTYGYCCPPICARPYLVNEALDPLF